MFCSSVELQSQPAPAAISTQLPPQCGSSGRRPDSLQPGVEQPPNAERSGCVTPGKRPSIYLSPPPCLRAVRIG
ncbi:MAG: hypothetical protein ACKO81_04690, partial [Planctomycetota bacterium]